MAERRYPSNGKQFKEWQKVRRAWLAANPPNHQGYYECYLCHKWIPQGDITLDHIVSRSRAPNLRLVQSNLAPCCGPCNTAKGSGAVKSQIDPPVDKDELKGLW